MTSRGHGANHASRNARPHMESQYNHYKNLDVEILAVNVGESEVAIDNLC